MSVKDIQMRLNAFDYGLAADGSAGPKTYAAIFRYMGAKDAASELGKGAAEHFPNYRVAPGIRLAHWLAQFGHESQSFTKFEESLNYSATRLVQVWPKRFPTAKDAQPYANNPEELANKVYGGRLGNTQPGDGWKYRGRGPQITGRFNYAAAETRTSLPLVEQPELAAQPRNFVLLACDFWGNHGCNELADKDDLRAITLSINGGYIGISERAKMLAKAERILLP
jgi:putative chitinase